MTKEKRNFQPTTKRTADKKGADFYPTPEWATELFLEKIKFTGDILEPACGNGSMSKVLEKYGYDVTSQDLHNRGYGEAGVDFLQTDKKFDNIVTNPPYNMAAEFLEKALDIANKKVAFLLRLAFLEGSTRYHNIFSKNPPNEVFVYSDRITFYPDGLKTGGSGTTAYAWFVWEKENRETKINWLIKKKDKL
jgi:hypothetical protein